MWADKAKMPPGKTIWLQGLLPILFVWLWFYVQPLSHPIIQQWDEARNAIHAQEMLDNGNYWIRYFNGKPETWELKPPLLIWFQMASTKIFGITEFGIRFPSALAALGMALLLFHFLIRSGTGIILAAIGGIGLLCTPAAMHPHGFMYGDHDALLCFFQASMIVACYGYFETGKTPWLLAAAISLCLGWYTKSIAMAFVLPGIAALALWNPTYRKQLFTLKTLLSVLISVLVIGSYYILRNQQQPGYIGMVNQEEWLGRFANHPDANRDYFYYLEGFYRNRLKWLFFPMLLALGWTIVKGKRNTTTGMACWIILFTLPIISISQSKNFWYDLPLLFPLWICLIGMLSDILKSSPGKSHYLQAGIAFVIVLFSVQSAQKEVAAWRNPVPDSKKEFLVDYINRNALPSRPMGLYCSDICTDLQFYTNNKKREGNSIEILNLPQELHSYKSIIMARTDSAAWTNSLKKEGLNLPKDCKLVFVNDQGQMP